MSSIPPDIAGAAAQAGFVSREASRIQDASRTAQQRAAARQVQAATDAADSVETTDADTAVFADAEGAGGQGRAFEEAASEEVPEVDTDAPSGLADGGGTLDIEA